MNIAICEDELYERRNIANLIKTSFPHSNIYEYESGEGLLQSNIEFDIIFLDIKMQGVTGIETARSIRKRKSRVEIIFVTGLDEYALQAFDVRAFHYLMKPLDKGKFLCVLREAVKICEVREEHDRNVLGNKNGKKSIIIKTRTNSEKIWINDIYCAEVNNRKVILYTKKVNLEYYAKLEDLEKELGESFFRCHRAYLVHLRFVKRYITTSVILENGMEVMMAKQKYTNFIKVYLNYMKRINEEDDRYYL